MNIRMTNTMMINNYLVNVNNNLNKMSTLQNQLSTGYCVNKASDDPGASLRIMKLNAEITANKQYNTNISTVSNWLDTTDTALNQAGNVLSRLKTLLVKAGDGAYGPDELDAIKNEVEGLRDQYTQALNTTFDGSYIFGGTKSLSTPVTTDANGKICYANSKGEPLVLYKNASTGDFTQNTTTANSQVNIVSPATADDRAAKTAVDNEIATLEAIPASNRTTDQNSRLNELKAMQNGSKPAYKSASNGTITSKATTPNESVRIEELTQTQINSLSGTMRTFVTDGLTNIKQCKEELNAEVSKNVIVKYNMTASDFLEFKDKNGNEINMSDLFDNIINALDNPTEDNLKKLTGEYNTAVDSAITNLLDKRAEVGALQNRMEKAGSVNEDQTYNMKKVLSGIQDIDITEKIMDYTVLQTVYVASLQTSASILPKTLMDYI